MRFNVIIPARYQSSRLPGKPLAELCGTPMIARTYRQCLKAVPREGVYVATDDQRIVNLCHREGMQVIETSPDCMTGTDRVAEAARSLEADIYLNIQGDEPVFNPEDIETLIAAAREHPNEVINGYCAISAEADFRSTSIPKVVLRPDGRLLYMSRAPIPTNKGGGFEQAWRQVCAYAFPTAALDVFNTSPVKTPLEQIEDIEILRFLELGWDVRMIQMSDESIAVDHPEDVLKAEACIRARGL